MCTLPRWASAIFLLCTLSMTVEAPDIHTASNPKRLYFVASAGPNDTFGAIGMSGELDLSNGWIGAATLGWKFGYDAQTDLELASCYSALDEVKIDGVAGTLAASGEAGVLSAIDMIKRPKKHVKITNAIAENRAGSVLRCLRNEKSGQRQPL